MLAGQQHSDAPEDGSDGVVSAGEPAEQAALAPPKVRKAHTRTRAEQRARRRQQQKVPQQRYRRGTLLAAGCSSPFSIDCVMFSAEMLCALHHGCHD